MPMLKFCLLLCPVVLFCLYLVALNVYCASNIWGDVCNSSCATVAVCKIISNVNEQLFMKPDDQ